MLRCSVSHFGFSVFVALIASIGPRAFGDNQKSNSEPQINFETEVQPLLKKYCVDCHAGDEAEGEFDLERFTDAASVREDRAQWVKARKQVSFGAMPPEDAQIPSAQDRAKLVTLIDAILGESGGCDLAARDESVTARRLNRAEYNRTIHDLIGLDLRPADAFPSDEVGDGFDNNANVLTLPPLLLERYLDAAEQVANAVIITPQERTDRELHQEVGSDALTSSGPVKRDSFVRHQLSPGGAITGSFKIPVAGRYRVTISIYTIDTSTFDTPLELCNAAGEVLHRFEFKQPVDGRFREDFDFPLGELALTVRLPEQAKATHEAKGEDGKPGAKGVAVVNGIRIDGPREWTDSMLPEHHRRVVIAKPGKNVSTEAAAEKTLLAFARRAFRSAVNKEDIRPYVQLVLDAEKRKLPYERGLEVALSGILVSPRFLFRIEQRPETEQKAETPQSPNQASPQAIPLTGFELANRLSYFLWSSMPDDRLLDAAESGALQTDDGLREEVERMIADPKADALYEGFASQWLGLRNLSTVTPNTDRYPGFNDALRQDMETETRLCFLDLMRSDQSVLSLLDGRFTFLNQRLAEHYGIKDVQGNEFRKVTLDGTQRAGLLSHASILTLTSNPGRTSPVKRGKWVMETLLGTPPPDPPPGVQSLEESAKSVAHLPLRKQLELHRADPACAACHRYMDAIGFGLENFDGTGRWRDDDQGSPIDTAGELPSGDHFAGPIELASRLRGAAGDAFVRVLSDRLLTYALGRGLSKADRCLVDDMVSSSKQGKHTFRDLLTEIALSPTFRNHPPSVSAKKTP